MKRTLWIIGLLSAATVVGVGYRAWSGPAPGPQTSGPITRVTASSPVRKTLRRLAVQPGQIEAFEQTPLFAKLSAYVERFHADIGDHVEGGKPLATLLIPELQEEVHQKEAMVAFTKAGVHQATTAVRAAEKAVATAEAGLREARAGTIRAQGIYERWKSEHTRAIELEASHTVDRRIVDETQNELSSAEASRGEAEAKVASAEAVLAERTVAVEKAKADLAVAETNVGNAQADLAHSNALYKYTTVSMPYTGIVVERYINPGDFVQPANIATAKPLFVVAQCDTVRIFVDVPEMEAAQVKLGAKASIHVQAVPGRAIEGAVTRTSWALGRNRTLRAELDIANPQGLLRPGMYANVEIVLEDRPEVLTLPLSAVVTAGKRVFCCCVEDGAIVQKPLSLGLQTTHDAEVVGGLKGEELVVVNQPGVLQVGQRVEVARPQ